MTVQTLTKPSTKTAQTFIRLNVDTKLDNMLKKYESQYHLLNRSDLVRMLLSEVDFIKSKTATPASDFFDGLNQTDSNTEELEALNIANQILDR
jgi:hypothetical protein